MTIRPVDENGDMMPISDIDQMLTGAEAVAQGIRDHLSLYEGEWWEDEDEGFSMPEMLAYADKSWDTDMFIRFITSYAAGSPGVESVDDLAAIVNGTELHLVYQGEDVEVDLDGVL